MFDLWLFPVLLRQQPMPTRQHGILGYVRGPR